MLPFIVPFFLKGLIAAVAIKSGKDMISRAIIDERKDPLPPWVIDERKGLPRVPSDEEIALKIFAKVAGKAVKKMVEDD